MRKQLFLIVSLLSIFFACANAGANATQRQNNADYRARRAALAKAMEGDPLVLFAPTEAEGRNNLYDFRQDDNFYYLPRWSDPGPALLINDNPYPEVLFLD